MNTIWTFCSFFYFSLFFESFVLDLYVFYMAKSHIVHKRRLPEYTFVDYIYL